MTRRNLFYCLGNASQAIVTPKTDTVEFYRRLEEFDDVYQKFINNLCHWPASETCRADLGKLDYAAFKKAGEMAKKLWKE